MAKSDHQDQGCLRFKWNVSAHVLLVFRPLASVCKRIYTVSFAISCKIVMSKYNLLVSLGITHLSMIMCNLPHPDHVQVKVGHTHATDMVK